MPRTTRRRPGLRRVPDSPGRSILGGLLLLALSAASTWLLWESGWIWTASLLPAFYGVEQLLGGILESRRRSRAPPLSQSAEEAAAPWIDDLAEDQELRVRVPPTPARPYPKIRELLEPGDPLEPGDLTRLERRQDIVLPETYVQFLRRGNGGVLRPAWFAVHTATGVVQGEVRRFLGLHVGGAADVEVVLARARAATPPLDWKLLPIATCEDGSLLCLDVSGKGRGSVWLWRFGSESPLRLNEEFFAFLSALDWAPGTRPPPPPVPRANA